MRITCTCGRSNRGKRKNCGLCGQPLPERTEVGPARTPPTRTWPPNGTRVSITRAEHGWHDGQVVGILTAPGWVRGDDGYEYEIRKPGDVNEVRR